MIFKKLKVITIYKMIKYLIIFLLIFGLIGDILFSPVLDIKIHIGNLIIGSLIWFVCWLKVKEHDV